MARTPLPPAEIVTTDFDTPKAAEVMGDLQRQGAELELVQNAALEVGEIAGSVKTALFLRACGDRIIASAFMKLREGRKYQHLQLKDADGNLRRCGDLKEACTILFGKSYSVCAELAQNYELLGAELYDHAEQVGLSRTDYRALRALPADDQKLVTDALEGASDRDSVADLIGELTERHAKKVAGLEKQNADLKSSIEMKDRRNSEHLEEKDKLKDQIDRLTHRSPDEKHAAALEREFQAIQALNDSALVMLGYIQRFHQAAHQVAALGTETAVEAAYSTVRGTYQRIADVARDCGINVSFEDAVNPPWLPGAEG